MEIFLELRGERRDRGDPRVIPGGDRVLRDADLEPDEIPDTHRFAHLVPHLEPDPQPHADLESDLDPHL